MIIPDYKISELKDYYQELLTELEYCSTLDEKATIEDRLECFREMCVILGVTLK